MSTHLKSFYLCRNILGKHWANYLFYPPVDSYYITVEIQPTAQARSAGTKTFWERVDLLKDVEKR